MKKILMLAFSLALFVMVAPVSASEKRLTIYAPRVTDAEKALYAQFQEKTGIAVHVVEGQPGDLIKRIGEEGTEAQADLFVSVDGGILHQAKKSGILQPIPENAIADIPKTLRDKENHWTALAYRARVIVYSQDRVNTKDLSTYEDLADPKWKGRVVVRSGSALYNQSLLASLIALDGEEKTAAFVKGLVENFASPSQGGDRPQVKKIADGLADVALVNTYYIGMMLNSSKPEEVDAAKKVAVFFPNQKGSGTHINVNGIGLVKNAQNKENAVKLIEFLASAPAQEQRCAMTFEFPANAKVKKTALMEGWGAFKAQVIDFAVLAENKEIATQIVKDNNWNED